MIISRTPLRVSFVGGGTDLPAFYQQHGGAVVATAIDKWIHVIVAPRFEGDVRVSYSRTEIVESAGSVEHDLVREAMRLTGVPRGVEIITLADVPSRGTGLGSSSAVSVGLLNALYAFQGIYKAPLELAEQAAHIEIDVLGKPIGKQDQYAAAAGGLSFIEFPKGGSGVRVEPLVCPGDTLRRLQRSLLLFYTGNQRPADTVLREQHAAIESDVSLSALQAMRDLAYELRERLVAGDADALGRLMAANWELKRTLASGVTNDDVDRWFDAALGAGATGAKLLGAGGGGFFLACGPPHTHDAIRRALEELREVPLRFAARGTHITLFEQPGAVT
jgi:D-glycero-alpha-D-manno-heptose-7-phosphate kinase